MRRPLPVHSMDLTGVAVEHPRLGRFTLPLLGRHQAGNAAVAIGIVEALDAAGVAHVPDEALRAGLAATRWPGRLELLRYAGRTVLVDGAHNPDGMAALAATIDELAPGLPRGRVTLLLGVMRDKEVREMLGALARSDVLRHAHCVATTVPADRSRPAGDRAGRAHGARPATGTPNRARTPTRRSSGRSSASEPRTACSSSPARSTWWDTCTNAWRRTRRAPLVPEAIRVRDTLLDFGARTYVMGIVNMTPDSFSGDGLLAGASPVEGAVAQALRMAADGADIIDIGGESTRPGHVPVSAADEVERVVAVVAAIRERLPRLPLSIDTSKPEVAEAALLAGADIINDVAAVTARAALAPVAAAHDAPYVIMHSRATPEYADVVAETLADLRGALERAEAQGCEPASLIVDPGIGFGKTAEQNLALLGDLAALRALGRAVLLGTSRKSTIGVVLDLPAAERLEGTLATTALGIAAGVDIVRVHDVAANVRAARMSDAIIRGGWTESGS